MTTIAEEIAAALEEAGEATGNGPLYCTLRRYPKSVGDPQTGSDGRLIRPDPMHFELVAIQEYYQLQNADGSLVREQIRKITVNATGEEPKSSDLIAIGVAMASVGEDTVFEEIIRVTPVSPGSVALMYELELAH